MRWWRVLWRRRQGDEARDEARAAAAMARLRGQCGVAAGECAPWDDERAPDGEKPEGAGDEWR